MRKDPLEAARRYVQRMYDQQPEREWERMERHRTEFALTFRALAEHLPPPPARILDCGGGPGRYAIELSRQGYEVVLLDLSPGCLQLAREKASETGVALAGYEQGTATDLSRFPDDAFDAVLLMGPLYHLLEAHDRQRAVAEARRVLKPGSPVFAAFITRYAVLRYVAAHNPTWPLENRDLLQTLLATGVLPPRGEEGTAFVAYFAHPTEVVPMLQDEGLEVVTVLGVEGLVSMFEEGVNALSGEGWETWVDINWRVAADPSIHGCVEHLLVVAHKPRWRAALRRVAQRLKEARVSYTVVGGTAAALHGAQVPVKDIDIETDVEGAYRFQDLFTENVLESVALSESEVYRSHFGRFDVDGVVFEVMGNLHRREGDTWVPTAATTETTVDLDGLPVHTSWLEEETLAYIRRGRLERAGQCLPHCDPGLLLELLRGERMMDVL